MKDTKMLQAILDGQAKMFAKISDLGKKIDKVAVDLTKRLNVIGSQTAFLERVKIHLK